MKKIFLNDYIKNLQKSMKLCTNPEMLGIDYTDTEKLKCLILDKFDLDSLCFRSLSEAGKFRIIELNNKLVTIDKDIADLIIKLNQSGYRTVFCCQGHKYIFRNIPNNYYISFTLDEQNETLVFNIFEKLSGVKVDRDALKSKKKYVNAVYLEKGLLSYVKIEKDARIVIRSEYNKEEAVYLINQTILNILGENK